MGLIKTKKTDGSVSGFSKDETTGLVINTNDYGSYLMQKKRVKDTKVMKNEMDSLKSDVSEIKNMLLEILKTREKE